MLVLNMLKGFMKPSPPISEEMNHNDLEVGNTARKNFLSLQPSHSHTPEAHTLEGSTASPESSRGRLCLHWRKAVRLTLTVFLYIVISYSFYASETQTVVYTCSDGAKHVAPRAVNSRFDTIFETVHSQHSEDISGYFCKVQAGMGMINRHPGKRIVYVDSDSVLDLEALIQDASCSRMTFGLHPLHGEFVSTSFFCFPGDHSSLQMLSAWYDVREQYPAHPRDQAALKDFVANKTVDFKVAMVDPTGIELAHCSHDSKDTEERDQCKRNIAWFVYWDRGFVLLWSIIRFGIWLLPLSVAFGLPLIMPGAVVGLLNVNPLTILLGFGIPQVMATWYVRNNRTSGRLQNITNKMFSGLVWLRNGRMGSVWVPGVGALRIPRDHSDTMTSVAFILLFVLMVIFRRKLDRWTCITCPTLWHWTAWSKNEPTMNGGCSSLTGAGRWLTVVSTAPNAYHLACASNTRGEVGVPVHRIRGSSCMQRRRRVGKDCSSLCRSEAAQGGGTSRVPLSRKVRLYSRSSCCIYMSLPIYGTFVDVLPHACVTLLKHDGGDGKVSSLDCLV